MELVGLKHQEIEINHVSNFHIHNRFENVGILRSALKPDSLNPLPYPQFKSHVMV